MGTVQDAPDAAGQNRHKPLAVGHERDGDDRRQGVGEQHPDAEVGGGVSGAGNGRTDRERAVHVPGAGGGEGGGSDHGEHRVQCDLRRRDGRCRPKETPASADESDGDG